MIDLLTMLTGTDKVLVCARLDFAQSATSDDIEQACVRIDSTLREEFGDVDEVFLEPVPRGDEALRARVRARYGADLRELAPDSSQPHDRRERYTTVSGGTMRCLAWRSSAPMAAAGTATSAWPRAGPPGRCRRRRGGRPTRRGQGRRPATAATRRARAGRTSGWCGSPDRRRRFPNRWWSAAEPAPWNASHCAATLVPFSEETARSAMPWTITAGGSGDSAGDGPWRRHARRHRRERPGSPARRPVRRRRVHADAREQVRVGGREDERHRAACGQTGHVDPPRVDPPAVMLVEHGAHHARERRGLAPVALLMARVVPAPTAVGVVAERLLGRDEHDAVPVGDRGEPGRVDERLGLLVAAVQQHQQRRAPAPAVPCGRYTAHSRPRSTGPATHRPGAARPTNAGTRGVHRSAGTTPDPDERGLRRTEPFHWLGTGADSTGWKGRAAGAPGVSGSTASRGGAHVRVRARDSDHRASVRDARAAHRVGHRLHLRHARGQARRGRRGRVRRRRDLRAGPRGVGARARRDPRPLRGAGPFHRPLPALPRPRLHRRRAVRPQPAPRRAQVRADGRAGHRPHPDLLRGGARRRRRPRPTGRATARRRRARRRARHARRLRGARVGHADQHLRAVVGRRAPGRPPRARPVPGQLPHPVPRLGPRGHHGRSPPRSCSSSSSPTHRT